MRTARLKQEYGVEFRWTVFPLHPETPLAGLELSELFAGREADIAAMQSRLADEAVKEGLPLSLRTRTYNSRLAQELGKWAESRGKGESFRSAVYHAYFVDGSNIALTDELLRIAAAINLPAEEAASVLATRSFSAAVDADWQRCMEMRITSVPCHIYGSRKLSGFSSYENFERLIGKDK